MGLVSVPVVCYCGCERCVRGIYCYNSAERRATDFSRASRVTRRSPAAIHDEPDIPPRDVGNGNDIVAPSTASVRVPGVPQGIHPRRQPAHPLADARRGEHDERPSAHANIAGVPPRVGRVARPCEHCVSTTTAQFWVKFYHDGTLP